MDNSDMEINFNCDKVNKFPKSSDRQKEVLARNQTLDESDMEINFNFDPRGRLRFDDVSESRKKSSNRNLASGDKASLNNLNQTSFNKRK